MSDNGDIEPKPTGMAWRMAWREDEDLGMTGFTETWLSNIGFAETGLIKTQLDGNTGNSEQTFNIKDGQQ